ncbi:ER lumen protein retaining receptor-domain-containing protein [Talaromyces proteolyticus]|uniref:ER lumen protein retaining receptor-domain-containing protein n=1 Tax=Talaromyces proteolyticus TaxID=1131652 RepID=A0AAD4KUQ8_9EURO|nr:ER lumen protein retaining receptor-domain-containing protein [Talaromyces proteolyticus]KAH8700360.1 ER lumen protein retaining receptor-domain-containing protein [Talaromyces proteolyticus]
MNPFRILGDLSHILSKCILIWAIHWNRSSEGVSLLTQALYAVVFVTRYLDLFRPSHWVESHAYLIFFKLFYLFSSFYIIALMTCVYPRTREREKSWKLATFCVLGSAIGAPIALSIWVAALNEKYPQPWFVETSWSFSIILESVCVLPQLLLLRQTTVPTVIDSYYLITLGSYRALYILNWLVRGFGSEHYWDPVSDVFGVVQTLLYVDFAWVYYTRQRVKLRRGGIVDSEDLRKSWFIGKILNSRAVHSHGPEEEEEPLDPEAAGNGGTSNSRWGARGISVSADETLDGHH